MTTAEACYLFDAAVYRLMTQESELTRQVFSAPSPDQKVLEMKAQYLALQEDCSKDLEAANPYLPEDHPINTWAEKNLDTYWLNESKRIKAQFA